MAKYKRNRLSAKDEKWINVLIGYARVFSLGQDHAGQVERLKAAGATKIFQEKRSGVDREREELKKCLPTIHASATRSW